MLVLKWSIYGGYYKFVWMRLLARTERLGAEMPSDFNGYRSDYDFLWGAITPRWFIAGLTPTRGYTAMSIDAILYTPLGTIYVLYVFKYTYIDIHVQIQYNIHYTLMLMVHSGE